MTRRDFELIAMAVRTVRNTWFEAPILPSAVLDAVAHALAAALATTNARFQPSTFLQACGVGAPVSSSAGRARARDVGNQ